MARKKNPKYIEGDERFGLIYDYAKINKIFNSLGCPGDVYNPTVVPWDSVQYAVLMSEREIGKTTNFLLYGMIMNWEYGTQIQYVRQKPDDIRPIATKDLFSVILDYDYIERITHGKYNSVYYKAKRWYWAKVDVTGTIEDVSPEHFMFMANIRDQENLKSGYNAPKGDFLIFDEFINKYYYPDEFIDLCNLIKTIFRGRRSPKVVMLANTINKHSPYFNELEVYDDVQTMEIGDNKQITTNLGTSLYVEIIGATAERAEKRSIINKLFFGFKNPKLASITGADWSMNNYQHIPIFTEKEEEEIINITNKIYIYFNNKYIRLDLRVHPELGLMCLVHWATRTYKDSIILTVEDRHDPRYRYKYGNGSLRQLFQKLTDENRFYFATNDVGSFFTSYWSLCTKSKPF